MVVEEYFWIDYSFECKFKTQTSVKFFSTDHGEDNDTSLIIFQGLAVASVLSIYCFSTFNLNKIVAGLRPATTWI